MINPNLKFLRENFHNTRIFKLQGGTGSGKTWSTLMFGIEFFHRYPNNNMVFSVCRKTFPSLRATAYRDFIEILESFSAYREEAHNKSEHTYEYCGNLFEFFSLDQPQKVRGRKRDFLFLNEANECGLEHWRQLVLRTSHRIVVDYNPSDPEHWLYELDARPDCKTLITTFRDNPHLEAGRKYEIELLQGTDEDYWTVYGLGQIGAGLSSRIFTHFKEIDEMPEGQKFYGLDFGFTNVTALVECHLHNRKLYAREIIYKPGLINTDIVNICNEKGIRGQIYADSAEPKSIEDLRRMGLNVIPAVKGQGSVRAGIDKLKQLEVYVTADSNNLWKESKFYQWHKDMNGRPTGEPVDAYNHAIDALRYAVISRESRPQMVGSGTYG